MNQLSLFEPVVPEYPYQRKPIKREAEIIKEVFDDRDYISLFLDDMYNIYPWKQVRWNNWTEQKFWTLGASIRKDGYFYMMEIETGNIFLIHSSNTKPYLKDTHHGQQKKEEI